MEYHVDASAGSFGEELHDVHPQERMQQALIILEEATVVWIVQVIAESHR